MVKKAKVKSQNQKPIADGRVDKDFADFYRKAARKVKSETARRQRNATINFNGNALFKIVASYFNARYPPPKRQQANKADWSEK